MTEVQAPTAGARRQRERRPNQSRKRVKAGMKRVLTRLGYRVERIAEAPGENDLVMPLHRFVQLDPARFYDGMRRNKAVVFDHDWAAHDALLDRGHFRWGIPPAVDLTAREPNVTYTDLIAFLSGWLSKPVHYLEIGVSVGMNFLPLCRHLRDGTLVALDIEEPFPVLRDHLDAGERIDGWDGNCVDRHGDNIDRRFYIDAHRLTPATRQRWQIEGDGPSIIYASADLFADRTWEALKPAAGNRPFNLIFSDAWHRPYALRHEAEKLLSGDYIDPDEFILFWDDLGGGMTDAFRDIYADVKTRFGPNVRAGIVDVYGTYHTQNRPHRIGYMLKLPDGGNMPATLPFQTID